MAPLSAVLDIDGGGHYRGRMPVRETVVILPCSSLEDLPTRQPPEAAAALLAAWTLPWHPWLVAQTGRLPVWRPAGTSLDELHERLVLLPSVSRTEAPAGWVEQLQADLPQSHVITQLTPRNSALDRLLSAATEEDSTLGPDVPPLAAELASDFFALALASLVVELLGKTMHYSSNVDRDTLAATTLAAAEAACRGDAPLAEEKLQRAFDLLGEARDYYYPVESFFLDVTLVAPAVWGRPFVERLTGPFPTSVLLTAHQAAALAKSAPESLAALRSALAERTATLVGGELEDHEQGHFSLEKLLVDLKAARSLYEEHLGRAPEIYGRFRGGFSPLLPCLLEGLGFHAALLAAFDGSQVPAADHCRFRWEGADGSALSAVGLVPCDAGDAASLLQLAERLGRSMQRDHVATVLFASWPGRESEFYEDLWRASKRCPTLGRFVTITEYLDATHGSEMPAFFDADAYLSSEIAGAVAPQPAVGERVRELHLEERRRLLAGLTAVVAPSPEPQATYSIDPREAEAPLLERLAGIVCRNPRSVERPEPGILAFNLATQPRTIYFPDPPRSDRGNRAVVPERHVNDVPGMGFAWRRGGVPGDPPVPMASGLVLRNEHFEVQIHPETGGIRAVHDYRRRRNRLSQQLAVQFPLSRGAADGIYTCMVADEVRVTASTPACGEITSTGRLLDAHGGEIARFRQATRLARGSRLVALAVELEMRDADALHDGGAKCVVRWAWRDEPAEIWRSLHGATFLTKRKRVQGEFLDVVEDDGRLTFFTETPTDYILAQENRLDTLLASLPRGEQPHVFQLALGLDVEGPAGNWSGESLPALATATAGTPVAERAWWFQCGTRSVQWTALGPLTDGRSGFLARLQELTGRYVKARIEAFRPIRSARKTNFRGEPLLELPVREGHLDLQFAGYQWIQIEAEWE